MRQSKWFVRFVLLLLFLGCHDIMPPELDNQAVGESELIPIGVPKFGWRPELLDLVPENINECSVVVGTLTSSGVDYSLNSTRFQDAQEVLAPGTHLGRVRYVKWDRRTGIRLLEAICVVPLSSDASESALEFLRSIDVEVVAPANDLAPSPMAEAWGDPFMECWYDPVWDEVTCDGVLCTPYMMLSEGDLESMAASTVYYCENGCQINNFSTYSCSGGGGSGGEVVPISPPEGGGGGDYCPNSDPECLLELRFQDKQRIEDALTRFDLSRDICRLAGEHMQALYAANRIFRGNPLIEDGDEHEEHDAMSRGGANPFTHVDQDFLENSTIESLTGLLLHEGWHLLGYTDNHRDDTFPYSRYPFSEQQSCVVNNSY